MGNDNEISTLSNTLDTDTYDEGERFRITTDSCADWAIRKIKEECDEYERIKRIGEEEIQRINERIEAEKARSDRKTSYLRFCLSDYFNSVEHKKTKTTEKYKLLSGTLVKKLGKPKAEYDDNELVNWLETHEGKDFVKVKKSPAWGEFKKTLNMDSGKAVIVETGEIVDCIKVETTSDTFDIELAK